MCSVRAPAHRRSTPASPRRRSCPGAIAADVARVQDVGARARGSRSARRHKSGHRHGRRQDRADDVAHRRVEAARRVHLDHHERAAALGRPLDPALEVTARGWADRVSDREQRDVACGGSAARLIGLLGGEPQGYARCQRDEGHLAQKPTERVRHHAKIVTGLTAGAGTRGQPRILQRGFDSGGSRAPARPQNVRLLVVLLRIVSRLYECRTRARRAIDRSNGAADLRSRCRLDAPTSVIAR